MKTLFTILVFVSSLVAHAKILKLSPETQIDDVLRHGQCEVTVKQDFIFERGKISSENKHFYLRAYEKRYDVTRKLSAGRKLKINFITNNGIYFSAPSPVKYMSLLNNGLVTVENVEMGNYFGIECHDEVPVEI